MAACVAAAFLLALPLSGQAATPTPLNTGGAVTKDQCASCHLEIGKVAVPGIVFDHGNHILYSCDSCHDRFPHRESGYSDKVPMETCFACHGVNHGGTGELATGKCDACHTKAFKLRPATHVKSWKAKPHATASKSDTNRCMICHKASKDCNPCHVRQKVKIPALPDAYQPVVYPRNPGPAIKIFPGSVTSMSQCVYCHPDIDKIKPGRIIFAHAEHLRRNYDCVVCHPKFGHAPTGPIKPDMLSCYRCHGLYHNGNGIVAEGDRCEKCHPKSFQLVPDNHTKKFVRGEHKVRAAKDAAYCAMCHKPEFCIGCHRGQKTSPNAPGKPVVPQDHRNAKWMKAHGPRFLVGEGACGTCHDDKSCRRCHKTTMPHPPGWTANHAPEQGVDRQDCYVCHNKDRNKCQSCHHKQVGRGELVRKACVPCHDQMKQIPATSIKNKGFAEHAVHFDVYKKKGKPYRCYECHVEYGSSAAAQQLELQQGHDVRLCYNCHGQLDPLGVLIAPYRGRELCVRCHQNLGV